MISFIIGIVLGAWLGVVLMCCLQINNEEFEKIETDYVVLLKKYYNLQKQHDCVCEQFKQLQCAHYDLKCEMSRRYE